MNDLLNLDETIHVRGIPIKKHEIDMMSQKLGGKLFDESTVSTYERRSCADMISFLDRVLAAFRRQKQDPAYMPEYIDIGDKSYFYAPVGFAGLNLPPTKRLPAGLVGWYRIRRFRKGIH